MLNNPAALAKKAHNPEIAEVYRAALARLATSNPEGK